ncbi:MAG: tRNA glutamyl-Q(34) synthetase GluQRS [Candidatus Pelagadaptatus aseana]|uniref:tRNA glutamyl-Q(34) synthetase GluQRS n=1 Tax=Candidatus Pelagadaptatus aseana TaxID=3120508 RepID=UPI0039B2ECA0
MIEPPDSTHRPAYTGRFAPSPTGKLHQGSLLAALASYLDARHHQGRWLVRMEDLDPPREQPGAATAILQSLEAHGLFWDGPVLFQSQRLDDYQEILNQLQQQGLTYPCNCNRQRMKNLNGIYDGHCRTFPADRPPFATRLCTEDRDIRFDDLFQGPQQQNLAREVGDFVIHRKDGLFAYQLAVSVDDTHQNISHVIRGCDLLDSTPRQLRLFELLNTEPPTYGHLPVIVNSEGQKLSKQTFAKPLDNRTAADNLLLALKQLGIPAPGDLIGADCNTLLLWATPHWQRAKVPQGQTIAAQS